MILTGLYDKLNGLIGCSIAKTENVAIRDFLHAMKSPNTIYSSNPDDFLLLTFGEIDTKTGEIFSSYPVVLACGKNVFLGSRLELSDYLCLGDGHV